jgi:protein-tyrosine phosphatase
MVGRMIDLHTHILPALDDGPATLAESIGMARTAAAEGITTVVATPHVRDDYPTTAAEMEQAVAMLRNALSLEGIQLEVETGGEIALDRLELLGDDELARFALGGANYLLLECPYRGWPLYLASAVHELRSKGFEVILAHPERNAEADPERLKPLVERGMLVQVTSASLDGRLGRRTRAAARQLIEQELAHFVASDAHAPELRALGMKEAARAIGDKPLATWLTVAVPRAILAGVPLPTRPATRPRRRLFRRR